MKYITVILISLSLLLSAGCQSYICQDGTRTDDPAKCITETEEETVEQPSTEQQAQENITAELPEEKTQETKKLVLFGEFGGDYQNVGLEVRDKGITLRFLGYYYTKKGEDFGKITGIRYKIKNEGLVNLTPSLKLSMVNNVAEQDLKISDVELGQITIEPGEDITEEAATALSFNRLDIEKTVRLEIYDAYEKGDHLFTVEAETDFSDR